MTKAETRVQIAKDVLKQIKLGTLKPKNGTFIERLRPFRRKSAFGGTYNEYCFYDEDKPHPEQLCEVLEKLPCKVCALGGIFAATVKRFNKFESVPNLNMDEGYDYLNSYFSKQQLDMIECSFELGQGRVAHWSFDPDSFPYSLENTCIEFGEQYKAGEERMVAIMKNIIKNKGTFVPN